MQNVETKRFKFKKDLIWPFALTLFFTININYDWRTSYFAWYGTLFLVLISYLYVFNGRIPLKLGGFSLWFVSFAMLCVFSMAWSLSASTSFVVIKSFIVFFAVLLLIQFSLQYGFDINVILKCYLIATLINAIYVLITVDLTQLGETQLGTHMLEGWNGNGIGFLASNGAIIACYLIGRSKHIAEKILYIISVLGLSFLTLYTGSRTAFLVLLIELMLYLCLVNPAKTATKILVAFGVVVVVFILVMNVEPLYNVLGSRIEGLLNLWTGEGAADSSASIRQTFIDNGIQWFKEQPLAGYGINNYKILNQEATGRFTYAHNNFIEIAVDLGILGLIFYYFVFVYLIGHLIKIVKKHPMNAFLLSMLVASLVGQYGTVSYYDFFQNLLILMCFFAIESCGKESEIVRQ